jgi:hypothetical protein
LAEFRTKQPETARTAGIRALWPDPGQSAGIQSGFSGRAILAKSGLSGQIPASRLEFGHSDQILARWLEYDQFGRQNWVDLISMKMAGFRRH